MQKKEVKTQKGSEKVKKGQKLQEPASINGGGKKQSCDLIN